MATLEAVLDSFLIFDPERSRSACTVFLPPVPESERERLGRFFLVAELAPNRPGQAERLRALQDVIAQAYYSVEDRGVESSLEHALSVANGWIQERVRREDDPWIDGLACFVGALRDTFFTFTRVGDLPGLLMRGLRIQPLAPRTAAEAVNPLKAFGTTWSGTLQTGDTLLVATTSLFDYFSQEKLRRMVSHVPPAEAAATLDAALRDNPTGTAFAALILQLHPAHAPLPVTSAGRPLPAGDSLAPLSSIDTMNARERSTRELLQPSLWRSVVLLTTALSSRFEDAIRTRLLRKPPRRRYLPSRERSSRPSSLVITALLGLWTLMRRVLTVLLALLIAGLGALVRLVLRRPTATPGRRRPFLESVQQSLAAARLLPRRQQLTLGVIVVAVVALVVGGINAGLRRGGPARVDRTALAATIREKTSQLENVLSYGDQTGGRTLLKEVDELIARYPAKRQADRQTAEGFRAAVGPARDSVFRLVRPTFTTQADLTGQGRGATLALLRIARSLYAVTDAGSVINVTTAGKPSSLEPPGEPLAVRAALPDGATLLLWTDDGLRRLSLADETSVAVSADLPTEPVALATFQQRLYVIDRATDQVIRFARAGSGYGNSTPWLTDRTERVRDATALAVDGSVYVAKQDGLLEYVQGARQALTLETIEPPLTGVTAIWTDEVSTRLYLLSPGTARLLVFTERGSLVAQYADDRFRGARGFAIDEGKKLGYVLTDTRVERFPLAQ